MLRLCPGGMVKACTEMSRESVTVAVPAVTETSSFTVPGVAKD